MDLVYRQRDQVLCYRPFDFGRVTEDLPLAVAMMKIRCVVCSPPPSPGALLCGGSLLTSWQLWFAGRNQSDFCPKGMASFLTSYPKSGVL